MSSAKILSANGIKECSSFFYDRKRVLDFEIEFNLKLLSILNTSKVSIYGSVRIVGMLNHSQKQQKQKPICIALRYINTYNH